MKTWGTKRGALAASSKRMALALLLGAGAASAQTTDSAPKTDGEQAPASAMYAPPMILVAELPCPLLASSPISCTPAGRLMGNVSPSAVL